MSKPKGPFCQSCGMPLERPDDFGTDADGFKINDYCIYCYKDGKFTEPNISMEQMVEKIAAMSQLMKMTDAQARERAKELFPRLKRWKEEVIPGFSFLIGGIYEYDPGRLYNIRF